MGDAPGRQFPHIPTAVPRIQENAIKHSSRRSAFLAQLNTLTRRNRVRLPAMHGILARDKPAAVPLAL